MEFLKGQRFRLFLGRVKTLEEKRSAGSTDPQKQMAEKDNRELEESRRQALLRSLATTALAYVAPYLCLARMGDTEVSADSLMTTRVREVKVWPRRGYTVVCLRTATEIVAPKAKRSLENVVYTFRNLSAQPFEPFVCIGRSGENQEVFAYADDNEFLIDKTSGEDEAVLQEVKKKAAQKGMRSLGRFVDLMAQAIKAADC